MAASDLHEDVIARIIQLNEAIRCLLTAAGIVLDGNRGQSLEGP